MARRLGLEARMTIKELSRRGLSMGAIAKALGVSEGAVRYHLRRQEIGAVDGRSRQRSLAESWDLAILAWVEELGDEGPVNLAVLHDHLVEEHGYRGSLRSLQRYFRRRFPAPRRRARRRVETPPGAQAQVDWAHYPRVEIAGQRRPLLGFCMQLSHSRFATLVWAESKDQLAWLECHNRGFERLEGVPATVRVDNEKTAVSRGAGAWGEINPTYRRYAETLRFHIDPCLPRAPQAKGKVERRIRDQRLWLALHRRGWESVEELQAWTDARLLQLAARRLCPVTGTSVLEAWEQEKRELSPVPMLPEAFDIVVRRRVAEDCMIGFEGRRYSVPFGLVGETVEVRGCARQVQILHGSAIVAAHARHTRSRLLLDPTHFEGPSTEQVVAPQPLGRLGRKLQEIAAMAPEQRPLDLYAALAEVAR